MKITHKNAPFDHYMSKPNVDRTNNIIIGIAVGVMISACGVLLIIGMVNS